jgi:tetratricopeptide (TPR) repeat protein
MKRLIYAAIVLALSATSAFADSFVDEGAGMPVPEKARLLADRGRQLQRDGKFAEALEAYKAAYVLAPSPGLLFNLAQAYRLNGDCDDAAWMYKRFLETDPREDLRALVNAHLEKLSTCTHMGFRSNLDLPNVPHEVRVMPSQPPRTEVVATAGSTDADVARARTEQHAGTYLMIGGGVGLAVAAVFAVDGHLAANEVADAYSGGGRNPDIRALDDRGHRDDAITAIAGISGGAALITGAVLYGMGVHGERAQHVAVVPRRDGGAEVKLAWQF